MAARKKKSTQQEAPQTTAAATERLASLIGKNELNALKKRFKDADKAQKAFETSGVVRRPGDFGGRASKDTVIPTGSTQLDLATGIGGIPRYGCTIIYGLYSSGKSQLAQHIARNVSLNDEIAVYVDAEGSLSDKLLLEIGANKDNVLIWRPSTVESMVSELITNILPQFGDRIGVVVLDSIPTLPTQKELEVAGSETDRSMMEKPRVWTEKLQSLINATTEVGAALVAVNQLREDGKDFYGNMTYRKPGGKVWEFLPSLFVLTQKGRGDTSAEQKSYREEGKQHNGRSVVYTDFVIEKNKVGGVPWREGSVEFVPGRAYPHERDVIRAAISDKFYEDFGSTSIIKNTKHEKGVLKTSQDHYTIKVTGRILEAVQEELEALNQEDDFEGKTALVKNMTQAVDTGYWSIYRSSAVVSTLMEVPLVVSAIQENMLDALNDANTYRGTVGVANPGALGATARHGHQASDESDNLPDAGEGVRASNDDESWDVESGDTLDNA